MALLQSYTLGRNAVIAPPPAQSTEVRQRFLFIKCRYMTKTFELWQQKVSFAFAFEEEKKGFWWNPTATPKHLITDTASHTPFPSHLFTLRSILPRHHG